MQTGPARLAVIQMAMNNKPETITAIAVAIAGRMEARR
jgi:hypothetical protein